MASPPELLDIEKDARRGDAARALLIGISFDLAFNQPTHGVAIALFALGAAVVIRARTRRSWEDDVLLAAAVVLASFTAVLAAGWVVALNLMMGVALVAGAVARTERPLFAVTIVDLLRRAGHVFLSGLRAPAGLLVPLGRELGRIGPARVRRVVRVVAITAPVLLLFTALLASADRVFGSLIVPDLPTWDLGDVPVHVVMTGIGALLGMTAFIAARRPVSPAPDLPNMPRALAPVEWGAILAGIDALFALFVAVQFAFLFGGEQRVRVTEGLTYAEYARSGFFQLLAVVILTVVLILALWDLGDLGRHTARFRGGVTVLIALTGVVLVSAMKRMMLYERTFGFTQLRLLVMITLGAIGVALAGMLAVIWMDKREQVVAILCCCAVGGLLALNIINPERFVAEHNVERFAATGKVDVAYLTTLGPDSAEASARLLSKLRGAERTLLLAHLCQMGEQDGGWATANLGRARAKAVTTDLVCARAR